MALGSCVDASPAATGVWGHQERKVPHSAKLQIPAWNVHEESLGLCRNSDDCFRPSVHSKTESAIVHVLAGIRRSDLQSSPLNLLLHPLAHTQPVLARHLTHLSGLQLSPHSSSRHPSLTSSTQTHLGRCTSRHPHQLPVQYPFLLPGQHQPWPPRRPTTPLRRAAASSLTSTSASAKLVAS